MPTHLLGYRLQAMRIRRKLVDQRAVCSLVLCGLMLMATPGAEMVQAGEPHSFHSMQERYQPIHQALPPGRAAYLRTFGEQTPQGRPLSGPYFQPVRISLPSRGQIRVYHSQSARIDLPAGQQVGLLPGFYYRLRISDMPEFAGVELYPTVEMLDRLHPPKGRAQEFPVPVELSKAEIETALAGGLVTKVVYLEQPNRAIPQRQGQVILGQNLPAGTNTLAAADQVGRPIAIVRLGGRTPGRTPEPGFFGVGVPAQSLPAIEPTARDEENSGPSQPQ